MTSTIKNLCLAVVVLLVVGFVPMTVQASANEPYGFQWQDDKNSMFHVQHYDFDSKAVAYKIDDRMAIKNSMLYDMAGLMAMNDIASFSLAQPTVAVNKQGKFFVVSNAGEIRCMDNSLDNTYKSVSGKIAKYFILDKEDLAESVMLSDGTTIKLSELTFSGAFSRPNDATVTNGAYVKRYAVNGNAETIGYDAYFNNQLKVTTTCKNSTVYVKQVKRTLSKMAKGGKFVGYTGEYSVYVYDLTGKLLEFRYADGYAEVRTVFKDEVVYSFEKNDRGFIKEIVTEKGKRPVSEVIKEPKKVSSKKISTVKNFQFKSMAYNGKELVGTLEVSENRLVWKGKKLAKSVGAVQFGVSAKGSAVWRLPNKKAYYYNGSVKLLANKVTALKFDKSGRVTKYKAKGKWVKFTK